MWYNRTSQRSSDPEVQRFVLISMLNNKIDIYYRGLIPVPDVPRVTIIPVYSDSSNALIRVLSKVDQAVSP